MGDSTTNYCLTGVFSKETYPLPSLTIEPVMNGFIVRRGFETYVFQSQKALIAFLKTQLPKDLK